MPSQILLKRQLKKRGGACASRSLGEILPIYLYECSCGEIEEITHSMFDDSVRACNSCGQDMRKKPSLSAVTFNGSGFYSTDK